MEKVKILIITQHFYPENFRINDIASEWVKRGYEVEAVTAIPNYPQGKFFKGYGFFKRRTEEWNGIRIHHIPIIPSGNNPLQLILNYYSFPFFGFFWNLFTRIKADYVFMFETSPMHQCKIGVRYAKKHKVPLYLYAQDLWPESFEMITEIHSPLFIVPLNHMVDNIYRACDRIFVTSESARQAVINRKVPVPQDKVVFLPQYAEEIYKPVNRQYVRDNHLADEIPDDDSFKIIFTGNIGYAQGLELLLEAAESLRNEKLKFVIVGDGRYREKLQNEVKNQHHSEMFIFTGRRPPESIPALLSVCDMAYISYKDNTLFDMMIPAKLQSYMACAMPILAVAAGETARIIKTADCGYCSDTGCAEGLILNIKRAMELKRDNPDELLRMSHNSGEYSRKEFGKNRIMDKLCGFIEF